MVFDRDMEHRRVAKRFMDQVNELLPSTDREQVFDALKSYEKSEDLGELIACLKTVLDEPVKMEIFEYVRPLVPPKHQLEYNKLAPEPPGQRARLIRLRRRVNEKLGFAVRGGFEHDVALFVSHVDPDSQAEQQGLKVGDEIVQVNGFYLNEAIHEEAVNLIKTHDTIELKVIGIGMLPEKKHISDSLKWKYVEKHHLKSQKQKSIKKGPKDGEEMKLFVNLRGLSSFGCRIASGPTHFPGIFVEGVTAGSLAEQIGLERGDKILDVNGTSFKDITHQQAVVALRESKELNIIIKKGAGAPIFKNKRPAPLSPKQVEEEEKLMQLKAMQMEFERERMKEHDKERQILEDDKRRKEEEEIEVLERLKEQQLIKAELKRDEEENREKEAMKMKKQEDERKRDEEERIRRKREEEEEWRQEAKDRLERQKKERDNLERKQQMIQERLEQQKQEAEQLKQQCDILAGRGVTRNSAKPTLLGAAPRASRTPADESFDPHKIFTKQEIGGRDITMVTVKKNYPLDIEVEGGTDSPLGGKIVVADIHEGGAVHRNGNIYVGDQIMMVDGTKLLDVTLFQANHLIREAEKAPGMAVKLVVAPSTLKNEADEVEGPIIEITYF